MLAATVVAADGGVQVVSGKRVMTLKPRDLEHYLGARGRRGALLPRGWRSVAGIEAV
jgi:topoisomerase-4 subunit A